MTMPNDLPAAEPLIRMTGIKKIFYTDEVETHALADIHLDIRTFAHTELVTGDPAIVQATLDNRALTARTALYDAATGRRALLEYPI